jgi:hypothetical protein
MSNRRYARPRRRPPHLKSVAGTDDQGDRRPRLQVQAVFDPEGIEPTFAYTMGMWAAGHHELHMESRPHAWRHRSRVYDPSRLDMSAVLGHAADLVFEGSLAPGGTFEGPLDGGVNVARYTLGRPVHPLEVEALGVAKTEGALVTPITWDWARPYTPYL